MAQELATVWVEGLPSDYIGTYGQKIAATTKADVDSAAKKYFPAAQTVIVVVGEENVRGGLAPFGLPIQILP